MRKCKKIVVMVLMVCIVSMINACGEKRYADYEGTWLGEAGSVLILYEDKTCMYKDGSDDEIVEGTWDLENDILVVSGCLDYNIQSKLEQETDELLFEADNSEWIDEIFTKTDKKLEDIQNEMKQVQKGENVESETDSSEEEIHIIDGENFSEGMAAVLIRTDEDRDKPVVINKEGSVVFELEDAGEYPYGITDRDARYRATFQSGGLLWEDLGEFAKIYDAEGNIIVDLGEKYSEVEKMGNGYYLVKKRPSGYQTKEVQYGVVNNNGEEVIPLSAELGEYTDGILGNGIILTGNVCISGEDGKVTEINNLNGGRYSTRIHAKRGNKLIAEGGICDLEGNLIAEFNPPYDYRVADMLVSDNTVLTFSGIRTNDETTIRVYDFNGNMISEEAFPDVDIRHIGEYSGGYASVEIFGSDGKYVTMLDENGQFVFEPIKVEGDFKNYLGVSNGMLSYPVDDHFTAFIDKTGEIVFTIDVPYEKVGEYTDGCVRFQTYYGYNYVDVENKKCVFEDKGKQVHFMK